MIIACWLLIFSINNCENRLINKVVMICCMACPWAPTAGGTTAQFGQRNDGVTAPNMQQLHQRLGHINRTLHADIEKPTTLVKTFNNLQKLIFMFLGKKLNVVEKICIWLLAQHSTVIHNTQYTTQQAIHNTKYIVVIQFPLKHCLHLIVGTTHYCDTQQTIHNTTNNTQHKNT